ncbi:MAG TPA: Gfo/Idh/MocA family oxidoreductase [Myxococcaceae bacterium]|nr:Gfo/Idh/MocA family oxidoreductase [Myxococcaceae bacterium]
MAALRVACVGSGSIAARHLDAVAGLPEVEIVGVASRIEAHAAALASRFGAPAFASFQAMLEKARPDALFICVAPAAHGEIERAALERGIPFLVEKPLAHSWEIAEEVGRAVKERGLVTAVGYQWRYLSTVERAQALLQGRRVALAQGYWMSTTPPPRWWGRQEESGGQMVEQTTHLFDLARLFLGEPESVYAVGARVTRASHPELNVDAVSSALVRFAGGGIASFNSACIATPQYRIGLHLLTEGMELEISAASLVVVTARERTEIRSEGDATVLQDADFLDAVRTRNPAAVRSPYSDALRSHGLAVRAQESAVRGEPIVVAG